MTAVSQCPPRATFGLVASIYTTQMNLSPNSLITHNYIAKENNTSYFLHAFLLSCCSPLPVPPACCYIYAANLL